MEIVRVKLIESESKGCEKAPEEIIRLLGEIKTKENGKELEFEKLRLEEIHVDLGDFKKSNHLILENSKEIFEKNHKAFFIGGDHSVSFSILNAFRIVEKIPLLIIFDAHGGCLEDDSNNKGWLKKLIDEGFDGRKIILIGVRSLDNGERDFLKENGVALIGMDVLREDLEGVCDMVMERARDCKGFYVSVDIDCIDPGFAPGVNKIEPGGISSRDLIYFIKRLSILKNFRGGDILNVNPDEDLNEMTVKLGAKLLSEML